MRYISRTGSGQPCDPCVSCFHCLTCDTCNSYVPCFPVTLASPVSCFPCVPCLSCDPCNPCFPSDPCVPCHLCHVFPLSPLSHQIHPSYVSRHFLLYLLSHHYITLVMGSIGRSVLRSQRQFTFSKLFMQTMAAASDRKAHANPQYLEIPTILRTKYGFNHF